MAKQLKNSKIGNEVKAAPKTSTPVRNTAVPKTTNAPKREVTRDMIAKRAYEISQSRECGSETDNWLRAERELRAL